MKCLVCGNDTEKLCLAYDENGRIRANYPVCDDCKNEGISAVQLHALVELLIELDGEDRATEIEDEMLDYLGLLPPFHVSQISRHHPFITLIPWSAEVTSGRLPSSDAYNWDDWGSLAAME